MTHNGDMRVRVVPSNHPRFLADGGRQADISACAVAAASSSGLTSTLSFFRSHLICGDAPHIRANGERGEAGDLDVAEEEAHDLLRLGGEGVGEAGEPHLLPDPDLRQRHLLRPPASCRRRRRRSGGVSGRGGG
ncbi:Os05g0542666, partial [Oryza sativa Japonica Group]